MLVAGAGIEPASGGYAYRYSFHCIHFLLKTFSKKFLLWSGLCLHPLLKVGCSPSSLYTFRVLILVLGLARRYHAKRKGFTEFDEISMRHFCQMSPF